jgi:RNA polymerase sigma factor (sigma-70 family)
MAVQFRRGAAAADDVEEPAGANWSTFTDIFREYAEYIFEYCISLLSDESAAADATVVTFITAQALFGYLESHDRLEAWLYALARRECTSRSPARLEQLPDGVGSGRDVGRERPDSAQDDTDELSAITRTTERRIAVRQALSAFSRLPEEDREVLAAFSALSPRDREVLDLVYWHGLSPAELPAILDTSAQRAQTLIAEAVRRFRLAAEDVQAAADEPGQEAGESGDKLAAAMPVATLPAAVWRRASRAAFDPELRSYRNAVVAHGARLRPDGFPAQPAAPAARGQAVKISAALLVSAAVGVAVLVYLAGSSSGTPSGPVPLTPDGQSTPAGVHRAAGPAGSAQPHAKRRHGALPITSLFPGQPHRGILPVPTPSGTNGFTPSPSPSTGQTRPAPSSPASSFSQPPPSKSARPSPSPTEASPTPTLSGPSPTPTPSSSSAPASSSSSP